MSVRSLDVRCFDEHAGVLIDGAESLELAYSYTWRAGGHPSLSQSLPLEGFYGGAAVESFFGPEYVRSRHLGRLIDDAGLGAAAVRRRLRSFAIEAPSAAHQVRNVLVADGWDAPVLTRVVEIVERRTGLLTEIAVPTPQVRSG